MEIMGRKTTIMWKTVESTPKKVVINYIATMRFSVSVRRII